MKKGFTGALTGSWEVYSARPDRTAKQLHISLPADIKTQRACEVYIKLTNLAASIDKSNTITTNMAFAFYAAIGLIV